MDSGVTKSTIYDLRSTATSRLQGPQVISNQLGNATGVRGIDYFVYDYVYTTKASSTRASSIG